MPLDEYRRRRDFAATPEPSGEPGDARAGAGRAPGEAGESPWHRLPPGSRFCVQMHRATRFHFDFRLEHAGVLLSWALPRGPSLDPAHRRLAVRTEDHPVDYGDFEGVIPSGYGAGTVLLWDAGTYSWTRESAEDPERQLARGDVKFELAGTKLRGEFAIVRIRGRRPGDRAGDGAGNWLLIKKRDDHVVPGYDAAALDVSVRSGRSLAAVAAEGGGDPREQRRRRAREGRPREEAPPPSPPAAPAIPAPMLATSVDRPFSRPGWLFEVKYDGVRAMVAVAGGAVRLVGRRGREETFRYPEALALPGRIRAREAVLDCEIVCLDEAGRPSFERLQQRMSVSRPEEAGRLARRLPVTFALFDAVRLDGRDLTSTALRIRKKTLHDVLAPGPPVLYADHVEERGEELFEALRRQGVEGMVAKRADAPYQPGRRSPDWLKVKAWQSQTCAIAGFTAGRGGRRHLGALVLAVVEDGRLAHCGQVGTGFADEDLRSLRARLDPLAIPGCPLAAAPRTPEPATWVRPELVCEVRHAGWTAGGVLRHPAYLGLRPDRTVSDCVRETPLPVAAAIGGAPAAPAGTAPPAAAPAAAATPPPSAPPAAATPPPAAPPAGGPPGGDGGVAESLERLGSLGGAGRWEIAGRSLRLTNLDKPLWPADGITKRDMIAYYVRMAPHLLPHLRDRPLSMQVFPDGIEGPSFWRKDKPAYAPAWIPTWRYHGEKVKDYILVNETATLAWLANAGVIDLHPWHSRADAPEQPDWAVFDLDPFAPATFADVVAIARLVRAALDHYRLRSVIKTSGQTGLQIYVPLRRGPGYDEVRGWVEEVGRAIGRIERDRVTWEWEVARRGGRIRIDYTQNIINKTLAAPYSLRPCRGAPVSTPISWDELDDGELRPDRWTIRTIFDRLARVGDLFSGALAGDQELPRTPVAP